MVEHEASYFHFNHRSILIIMKVLITFGICNPLKLIKSVRYDMLVKLVTSAVKNTCTILEYESGNSFILSFFNKASLLTTSP